MNLQDQVMGKMKEAMKAKDTIALQALRAVKSAFLLAKTETGAGEDYGRSRTQNYTETSKAKKR